MSVMIAPACRIVWSTAKASVVNSIHLAVIAMLSVNNTMIVAPIMISTVVIRVA